MILFEKLCGTLTAIYLIYVAVFSLEDQAKASAGPAMAMTFAGEHVPAMEAVRISHLEAYKARYLNYPAVLVDSRWISVFEDQKSCTQNPKKVWAFTGNPNVGYSRPNVGQICKLKNLDEAETYDCGVANKFGKTSHQDFTVRFGDIILPDWALERPHITLKRDGWPQKTIGLQMCESSSA